ncbi:glutathione S-transferase LANCL1 isoform X3 [Ambystoma mexicanum]|uniref:glutathione S-transferase LANCL1 isoform X3 n=1 Tax=Ambystoma mexicanum TaxID=8296 RepID=UPI0037E8921E
MSERAFQNPYPDFNPHQPSGHFDTAGRLTPEFTQRLQNKIWELLQQMEKGLKSADPGDGTVYTGWAGIALLYLHLFKLFRDTSHLHKAQEYISKSLKCMSKQGVTFLCGDAGPLAVGAAVYYELQQEKEAEECIRRLLQMHQSAVKLDARMADELLYGRLGYLYALLFVNKRFNEEKIPASYIQQPDCGVCQDSLQRLVKPSVDFVNQLKFPSGNFPPCIDDTRDLLVHWCHGAPGVIYMLIQAYKMFREQSYLTSFLQCADVIWQRGLLKKGYGLCHGAAGNAYGFLALYNLTEDLKYLHRACMFADWCIDYGDHGCRTPDTPFSLFEGMAGTIYFLADMLEPNKAKFPAFEM